MSDRTAVIYRYDGSFHGLMCAVFESYERKETPIQICSDGAFQTMLFSVREIETDLAKAKRVKAGVLQKMSKLGWEQIRLCFLSCHPEKELLILRFIRMGMKLGKKACYMLTDPTVAELEKAIKHLTGEAHQYKGFVRFSIYENILVSLIEPKNRVLPLLARHFSDRYPNETFLIYDKTHAEMLVYRPKRYQILSVEEYSLPEAETEEQFFRSLWKNYYDTIAIEGRENPRCRMGHMQKRYWNHLTEMDETLTRPVAISALDNESENRMSDDQIPALSETKKSVDAT